ncbi:MAG: PspC domain-containing protein [Ruminococcus sp.]|nr:PspC domain-containing protein [Ruminococcus sp.]
MMEKKLHRKAEGQLICGVCTGIAEYFNADITLVRIIAVILGCCSGSGVLAYIIAALLMPTE